MNGLKKATDTNVQRISNSSLSGRSEKGLTGPNAKSNFYRQDGNPKDIRGKPDMTKINRNTANPSSNTAVSKVKNTPKLEKLKPIDPKRCVSGKSFGGLDKLRFGLYGINFVRGIYGITQTDNKHEQIENAAMALKAASQASLLIAGEKAESLLTRTIAKKANVATSIWSAIFTDIPNIYNAVTTANETVNIKAENQKDEYDRITDKLYQNPSEKGSLDEARKDMWKMIKMGRDE